MDKRKIIIAIFALAALLLTVSSAFAMSSFPGPVYPGNQYGHEYRYYSGPWGERMVYGGYGYFPNYNGYRPYGYKTYGSMYTPWDIRTGRAGYVW
jgi:hypothetical protein